MIRRNVFTTYDPQSTMGKKFVAVHVQNEDPLYFLVEVKSKVCDLFIQISKFLNLLEPELFGLAVKSSDTFIFLDQLEKLSRYAPKQWKTQNNGMDNDGLPLFNVYFRVQYYVDSYLFISDKVAKYYYYHQLRENVLNYEQSMCEERSFLLASYALQADFGNYNSKLHKHKYFDPEHYFPAWVIDELGVDYIQRHLPSLHCDHKGMSKSEAQSMFIREASDPTASHNFHLYKMVSNNKKSSSMTGTETWLAITITGLMIYASSPSSSSSNSKPLRNLKTRISFFPWSDIGKLSFEKKKFEIRSIGPQSRKFVYYTGSEELARFLLWFSRASHQFHLMVLPKMKEMLKREAEINRRKYREACISSSISSRNSSSGNSSATSSSSANPNNVPSSNNTSKSVSPFEFSSVTSQTSSVDASNGKLRIMKGGTSDLDISSSSVCCGIMDMIDDDDGHDNDSNSKDVTDAATDPTQRISVISNASSNTTSGIASDKMGHGLGEEDSDRDDHMLSMSMMDHSHHHHLLMSLNHRHRAMALSGFSPQPVVSMESLALSEPTNDHHRTMMMQHHHHQNANHPHHQDKSDTMRNMKKHSISISNIMITTTDESAKPENKIQNRCSNISTSSSSSSCSSQPVKVTINSNSPTQLLSESTNDPNSKCSKLCLNVNETKKSSKPNKPTKINSNHSHDIDSDPDDDSHCSLYDSDGSEAFDDEDCDGQERSTSKRSRNGGSGGSGGNVSSKSNVTVLSTILKPEAERLLKQGIDVSSEEVVAANSDLFPQESTIDSLELAELKEFEKQEKEKIILNSLIDNIPPPPLDDSSSDSSDSDSSDSEDEDEESCDGNHHHNSHHYSPLAQEKRLHNKNINKKNFNSKSSKQHLSSSPKGGNNSSTSSYSSTTIPRFRSKSTSVNQQTSSSSVPITKNHIYENVPLQQPKLSQIVQALMTTPTTNSVVTGSKFHSGFPPTVPLRPYPSLNSVPLSTMATGTTPHQRTGMRIGVSSLSRPNSSQKYPHHLLLQPGCIHSNNIRSMQNIPEMIPGNYCPGTVCGGGLNSIHPQNPMNDGINNMMTKNHSGSNLSGAGSEPNLYFYDHPHHRPLINQLTNGNLVSSGDGMILKQETSTPKMIAALNSSQQPPPQLTMASKTACTFRQFLKNQLGSSSPTSPPISSHTTAVVEPLKLDLSNRQQITGLRLASKPNAIDSAIYITPPPSADYMKKQPSPGSTLEQFLIKQHSQSAQCSPASQQQQMSNNSSPRSFTSEDSSSSSLSLSSTSKPTTIRSKESRLKELRQRTSDLNLPLITALFNDSSLQLSDRFMMDHRHNQTNPNKSQSMQHLSPPTAILVPAGGNGGGSCGSSSLCSSTSTSPSRHSPSSVERSCTFRVDECIAKSAMRNCNKNNCETTYRNSNNINNDANNNIRPISWHFGNGNILKSSPPSSSTLQQTAEQRRLSSGNGHLYNHHQYRSPMTTTTS